MATASQKGQIVYYLIQWADADGVSQERWFAEAFLITAGV